MCYSAQIDLLSNAESSFDAFCHLFSPNTAAAAADLSLSPSTINVVFVAIVFVVSE